MIRTRSLVSDISGIPREWVFEYFLDLPEVLSGQDVRLKSPFNPRDTRPSMYIYFDRVKSIYKFKDFSMDRGGDGVTLVQHLRNLSSRGEAAHLIIEEYNQWILNHDGSLLKEFKIRQKFKVDDFVIRQWNTLDQKYWTQFHIGSRLLEKFQVKPLESYSMSKEEDGKKEILNIVGKHFIYGYFRTDGTLYKIYQPKVKDNKFIKVQDYVQGTDQLSFTKKYLVICSSLKDVMAFTRLGYEEAEAVAPDSENVLIPVHIIDAYSLKYKGKCSLFDNDDPGIKAMQKYQSRYNIPFVHLTTAKDLADSLRDIGVDATRKALTPLLKKAFHGK